MLTIELFLALGFLVLAGLCLLLLVHADRQRRRHQARLRRSRRSENGQAAKAPRRKSAEAHSRSDVTARLERHLSQTSLRLKPAELLVQLGLGVLGIYALAVLVLGLHPLLALPVAVALPLLTARLVLHIAKMRYRAAFTAQLPEALDIFARGLRAGRPVADSLAIVVGNSTGPVGIEFSRCHDEICMGTTLTDSLNWLEARVPTPEVSFFSVATALQAETGGNLIETMEGLANQLRERRKLRKKARALSSEARASALILASLPFAVALAIALLNGAYLEPLYADPRGRVMSAVAITSIGLGVWTMARMESSMSDLAMQNVFWLAFAGLVVMMSSFAALLYGEAQRSRVAARLARANGTGQTHRATPAGGREGSLAHARTQLRRIIVRMGERLSVVLGGEARDTAAELSSAGYRSRDALLIYAFLKTVLPLAAVLVGMGWVLATVPMGVGAILPAGTVIAAALALSKGVDIFVDIRRKKRLTRIRRGFPDMLELLVISSEAGLGPQPALHRVARELALSSPDLAREILQMVSEMRMTNDRRAAYDRLNIRVSLPEMGVFTQTLDQSDTYGTPFSRAMRTLIAEQRWNRLMAVEEKAARLPVIMTLPLIFCIMPAVFVVLIGPAALSIFDNILAGG